ncbi:MAG: RecX family transcriptional regulator [Flavobacteriales bacterium]|nr:RecX family transcriptional regulator [Flavobacteriales bacterium]|tara:strand:+ start:811 stop:1251 length:441 start_codon:yes stop_codon:yes gene_type:complete
MDDILKYIFNFCATQERCKSDVIKKLTKKGVNKDQMQKIINQLIDNDFINEKRYSEIFSRGKFRINKWGKIKISHHLKMKNVSENDIKFGVDKIDSTDYENCINEIISKRKITTDKEYENKMKIIQYLQQKGFEYDLIWKIINKHY